MVYVKSYYSSHLVFVTIICTAGITARGLGCHKTVNTYIKYVYRAWHICKSVNQCWINNFWCNLKLVLCKWIYSTASKTQSITHILLYAKKSCNSLRHIESTIFMILESKFNHTHFAFSRRWSLLHTTLWGRSDVCPSWWRFPMQMSSRNRGHQLHT